MHRAEDILQKMRLERHGAEACARLDEARIGIAGLGGLGSQVAMALARVGVGQLVLVDFDRVDYSNLHRQNYGLKQVGQLKTEATRDNLLAVDPALHIETHTLRLTQENSREVFSGCDIVCEAFDIPSEKALLVETLLSQDQEVIVISASGMAGLGSGNTIRTRQAMKRLYICGDEESDVDREGALYAPRVALCANHQALMTIRLLLGATTP